MTDEPFAPYEPPPRHEQIQAVALAVLCAVLFLGDGLLPGRSVVPFPPEAMEPLRSEALAAGRVQESDLLRGNAAMADRYNQALTWDRITQRRLCEEGRLPLWTRAIGGGAAFVPQMGQIYQPWNLLLFVWPSAEIYGPWYLLHLVVFGWLAYRFLRRIGCRHHGALLGVVCVTVGLWTQARVHHNVILSAALPLFGMLSCTHHLFRHGGGAGSAALLGIGTGISWLGGMPQISLLVSYLVLGYALALWWTRRPRALRPVLWTAAGMATGGLIGAAQMGPVLLAGRDTSRALGTAADLIARSLEFDHLRTLVWPDLLAWPASWFAGSIEVTKTPWAALLVLDHHKILAAVYEYPETAFAVGIPALVAAPCALRRRAGTAVVLAGTATVLGFLFAAGVPPLPWLAEVVPGMSAGDPRRLLFVVAMGLSILAAVGFDRLVEARRPSGPLAMLAAIAVISGIGLLRHQGSAAEIEALYVPRLAERLMTLPEATGLSTEQAIEAVRQRIAPGEAAANGEHLRTTFGRALVVALLAAALVALRRRPWARLGLIALTAAELVHAGAGPVVVVESHRVTTPPAVLAPAITATQAADGPRPRFQRLAATPDARRASLLSPNLPAFWGLEDLSAYNPLPPRRMEEMFDAIETGMAMGGVGVDLLRRVETLRHPMMDVLGLRWVLAAREVAMDGIVDRTPAGTAGPFRLYERTTTLPRATFTTRARLVADKQQRLRIIADPARDAATEVLLEQGPVPQLVPDATATVVVRSQTDERVVVDVRNDTAGVLRLADPWAPGWRATVDGAETPVLIADHYLRAVRLRPGEHEVVFSYDGTEVWLPRWIAAFGLLAVAGLLGLAVAQRRRETEAP